MRKPKIAELDIVRAAAIAAVLLIHGTAEATVDLPPNLRSHALYTTVNVLSNYAVPVFLLLSGLVLFYSYFDHWSVRQTLGFYRKRLQYILIPYLVWAFFYYVYNQWLDPNVPVRVSVSEFFRLVRWADTSYHLYFMIIIMQFYVLFPLLVTLAKKWRMFARYLWLFGVAVQAATFVYSRYNGPIPHGPSLAVTYFALFCIGGSLGMNYERFVAWLNRNIWWVTALATALGFGFALMKLLNEHGMRMGIADYEIWRTVYPVLAAMSFIWIGRHAIAHAPRIAAVLSSLGAASFGVYFIHPALLSAWRTYIHFPPGSIGYHLALVCGMALIFAIPWALVAMLKQAKGSWVLFGK